MSDRPTVRANEHAFPSGFIQQPLAFYFGLFFFVFFFFRLAHSALGGVRVIIASLLITIASSMRPIQRKRESGRRTAGVATAEVTAQHPRLLCTRVSRGRHRPFCAGCSSAVGAAWWVLDDASAR